MRTRFQIWAKPAWGLKFADHTSVYCPDIADPNERDFMCWGNSSFGGKQINSDGIQEYNIPDSYRFSIIICGKTLFPDTAGIGLYAVNGVCHQSANCFCYGAGIECNSDVGGYTWTKSLYGKLGNLERLWLENIYEPIAKKYRILISDDQTDEKIVSDFVNTFTKNVEFTESSKKDAKFRKNLTITNQELIKNKNELVKEKLGEFINKDNEIDITSISNEKYDSFIKALKDVGNSINELSRDFQKNISDIVSNDRVFKKVSSTEGRLIDIIDTNLLQISYK